ncbi:MAG: class I SAM-dependent methyltransferase [Williamsia herbipolensis]|nr:class I SAM-dependent methyltransferase [Williamsia herbipolensis]
MPHEHGHHGHTGAFDGLDDETAAFARHWDEVLDRVADSAGEPSTAIDLGTGTGVAAIGLARRLPATRVLAVDAQDTWFGALRKRAERAGVGDRVRTVVADIDDGIPLPAGSAGLVFASNCLHHVGDAGAVLRRTRDVATDDALLCVVEVARPMRVLADDDPAAPAERRAAEALGTRLREVMPLHSGPWAHMVGENRWEVVDVHEFVTAADPTSDDAAERHALRHLGRLAAASADRLTAADAASLADAVERARRAVRAVSWHVDGSRIAVLARPARTADTR